MNRKGGPEEAADRDQYGWEESDSRDREQTATVQNDAEDAAVAVEVDLDDLDAPLDPDFAPAEGWDFDPLELDDDDDDADDAADDEADEQDAEMILLQELGIDLDAPDTEVEAEVDLDDLAIGIDPEDPADEGVAA
jgi:hypothetical protein